MPDRERHWSGGSHPPGPRSLHRASFYLSCRSMVGRELLVNESWIARTETWLVNDLHHYRDFLKPRGLGWVVATLRVVVAAQCFGVAMGGLQDGTSVVADFLMQDLGWQADRAANLDRMVAYGMAVCGVLTLLRPSWPVLLPVIGWMVASAFLPFTQEVDTVVRLSRWEHSVRWAAPVALLLLDFWPPRLKTYLGRCYFSLWLLRLALTATLVGSGGLALWQSIQGGPLLNLCAAATEQLGIGLADTSVRGTLGTVGAVNLGLAINVLLTRSRSVLFVTALWGLLTAFSRVIAHGPTAMPDFLIRIGEGGVPLAMLLYYKLSFDHPVPQMIPEKDE